MAARDLGREVRLLTSQSEGKETQGKGESYYG